MSEFLLSEYADETALAKQTQAILDSFDTIEARAVEVGIAVKNATSGGTGASSQAAISQIQNISKATAAYSNTATQLTTSLKASTAAQKQLTQQQIEARIATQQRTADIKQSIIATNAEVGSYNALQAQLKILTQQYKALSAAQRDGVIGKGLSADILETTNKLKVLDAAIGNNQRNVGNYENAIVNAGKKAFGFIRTAANILPGLGLSGAFLLIFEGIKYVTDALGLFTPKLDTLINKYKLLKEVNEEAAKTAGKEAGSLQVLRAEIENTLIPMDKRYQAIKNLREQYPELLKNTTDEALLQGKSAAAYDLVAKAILRKAQAQAAEAKIQELSSANLDIILKSTVQADEVNEKIRNAKNDALISSGGAGGAGGNLGGVSKEAKRRKLKEDFDLQKEQDAKMIKLNSDKINILLKFAAVEENIKVDKPEKVAKEKISTEKQIQALKDRQNAAFDLYKIAQEAKLRADETDLKSDRVHYLDKLNILEDFVKKSKELLDRQEQNDIALKEKEAAREIQRLNEEKTGKNGKQIARINENIRIVQDNLEQDILKIKAKAADDGLKLIENAAVIRIKITDDQLKADEAYYAEFEKADQDSINKTKERQKKAYEALLKQEEEYKKKSAELAKELTQQKIELGLKGEGFLYSLATATFQNQLNLNRQQQDAVSQKQQEELKANDALVQSAEDKANNIILINARAQAQKDILDKKNRDIETQKAKFERAQQIFEIGISTIKSLALIKANAVALSVNPLYGPVFGKILAAQAMAQIPLLLATSALSVGALLAQPLPKYFKGRSKDDPYTGYATVNEIRREVIERKDGSIEYPTGKNVLTYLNKGDAVHPFGEDFMNSLKGSAMRDAGRVATKGGGVAINFSTRTMEGKLDKQNSLLQQIADKPTQIIHGTEQGMTQLWRSKAKDVTYFDQNTNW